MQLPPFIDKKNEAKELNSKTGVWTQGVCLKPQVFFKY